MEISVYAVYPDTCGRLYPYIFVYADVTVSEPVFFRARFSKMAASRNVLCSMLLGLLSSLIACLQLNVAMLNLNFNYLRRRLSIMRLLAISDSGIRRQRLLRRAGRQLARPRRFWVRPGRTSAWWDNFVRGIMIEEEWRENFRMSRGSLYKLADELRPYIEGKRTIMRTPVDVIKQVAVTLYYLSDEGRLRKTANAFGISRQVVSKIVRKVCKAITVHLGKKYIKLTGLPTDSWSVLNESSSPSKELVLTDSGVVLVSSISVDSTPDGMVSVAGEPPQTNSHCSKYNRRTRP